MTRSSRHKSHKQSKHSSRDDRDYSDSDVDVKMKEKNGKEEGAARVSRDSGFSEKRKVSASQSRDVKDPPPNGDASEEHGSSRRRKDRADAATTDRWNGGGDERADGVVLDKEAKGERERRVDSEKSSKSKGLVDSKSKASRRHEGNGEKKEEIVNEKEESKSSKVESKRKLEKDLGRREVQQHRETKEKEREKDYGSEKDREVQDVKRDTEPRGGNGEAKRRQVPQVDYGEERQVKRVKNAESPSHDELRNAEPDRELEKRTRRRADGSNEKDKYQDDVRESDEKRLSSKGDYAKNGKYREERQKDGSDRDKYREEINRDHRQRDGKQREDVDREKRHRDEKYRDDRGAKDYRSEKYDSKSMRDENYPSDSHHKKLKSQNSDRDGSPVYDDRRTRYKDDRERRKFDDRDGRSDFRSQSTKEQHYDLERKSSMGKVESDADRGRSYSRHTDLDSGLGHNRRRSSPSSSSHNLKEHYRQPKQSDEKLRLSGSEERVRPNSASSREIAAGGTENASIGRSIEKSFQKDDNHFGELSAERGPNSDSRISPMKRMERSPSSIDRRYANRGSFRHSIEPDDSGHRSGGYKDIKNPGNESKVSRELLQAHSGDELSHVDGDNLSLSSPFNRNHLPNNHKSFLPPPPQSRGGVDSPSVYGPSEDGSRGKTNNRGRMGDSNNGRVWKGAPNWSPAVNGFIPFQHGPPPGNFHPGMQQFPGPSMFGVRHPRDLNHARLPYYFPDSDRFSGPGRPFGWRNPGDDACPPPMHAWDANNGVMGNDSHMYGRLDWDNGRSLIGSRGWETSMDMSKQNGALALDMPSVPQKEDYSVPAPADVWPAQSDQVALSEQNESNPRAESVEINQCTDGAKGTSETSEDLSKKTDKISKMPTDDNVSLSHFYLAKLDISVDLTDADLYNQCSTLVVSEQEGPFEEDASLATVGKVRPGVRVKISSAPRKTLFATINDSISQRALSLYNKQKEEMKAIYPSLSKAQEVASRDGDDVEPVSMMSQEKEMVISPEMQETFGNAIPTAETEVKDSVPSPKQVKAEMLEPSNELEVPLTVEGKPEPDPVDSPVETNPAIEVKMEVDPMPDELTAVDAIEDQNSSENLLPVPEEEVKKLDDTVCEPMLFSSVSSEACEAEIPESIESGLVNISRIQQSQSTH